MTCSTGFELDPCKEGGKFTQTYMAKADYDQAGSIITYWANNGMRSDWVTVLTALINIEKNAVEGVLALNDFPTEKDIFTNYCENENEAQRLACAILAIGSEYEITEPHALPESGSARNAVNGIAQASTSDHYATYPNPSLYGFNFERENTSDLQVEVSDLLGRVVKSQRLRSQQQKAYIDITDLPMGIYIFTAKESGQIIYITKIAKEN